VSTLYSYLLHTYTSIRSHVFTCVALYRLPASNGGRSPSSGYRIYLQGAVNTFQKFFDINGLVRYEFVPPGQSVTGCFYVQVFQRLRDAVRRKRHDKWQGQWFLLHDKAPSHTPLALQQFLAEKTSLLSSNHRTLLISLRVTFGCSLLRKWASRRHVSQPGRTSDRM
jgi:hypothetical protein